MPVSTRFVSLRWFVVASLILLGSLPGSLPAQVQESLDFPLIAGSLQPCIEVGDLDFGGHRFGSPGSTTLQFRICNTGDGPVQLLNPPLIWDDQHFFVDDSTLEAMKSWVLAMGECREIPVHFQGDFSGKYHTIVKVNSTGGQCGRDSSIWTAEVYDAISVPDERELSDEMSIAPNPTGRNISLTLLLTGPKEVRVDILNMQGSTVATPINEPFPAGRVHHTVDLESLPVGLYRIIMRANGLVLHSQSLLIVR